MKINRGNKEEREANQKLTARNGWVTFDRDSASCATDAVEISSLADWLVGRVWIGRGFAGVVTVWESLAQKFWLAISEVTISTGAQVVSKHCSTLIFHGLLWHKHQLSA